MLLSWLLPLANADVTLAVLGDAQTDGRHSSINWDVFPDLVASADAAGAEVLLVAGDLVAGAGTPAATAAQWADFNAAIATFDGAVYMVPGNHDMYGGPGSFAAWREAFPWLPTDDSPPGEAGVSYYIDLDDTRVVMITSDHEDAYGRVSSAGLAWLGGVLADRDRFEHVFVVTHHPVTFSQDNSLGGVDGDFWQLLVAYGVTGLFTGHWHRYQPSQPGGGGTTWETIIGTGGGWQGYEPIRDYQQEHGFLLISTSGGQADAVFYTDPDGDGRHTFAADDYTMAWETPPSPGLRARYRFDSGDARDDAPDGSRIDGVLLGGAAVEDGALALGGGDDGVEAGAIGDYALALTGAVTISAQIRVDAPGSDTEYGSVIACYATNDYYTEDEETNYTWYLSLRPDGVPVAFWEHGDGDNVYLPATAAAPALADGGWHHIAITRAEAEVTFWVDGARLGDPVAYTAAPTGGGRGMVYLGRDTPAFPGYGLHGSLDEVCIFDDALAADEVAALAAGADCATLREAPSPDDTGHQQDTGVPDDTSSAAAPPEGGTPAAPGCGCGGGQASVVWLGLAWLLGTARRHR